MRPEQSIRWLLFGLPIVCAVPAMVSGQPAEPQRAPCLADESPPIFSEIGTSDEAVEAFLVALQKAVASDDRRKVVSMIKYPIAAWALERDVTFKNRAALLASYDVVFTPRLKRTITEASRECIFTNSQGAMIHDGEIWFGPLPTGSLKIIKINGPIGERQ